MIEFPKGNPAADVYEHDLVDLRVLMSRAVMNNGDSFIHISVSKKHRSVTWADLTKVKNDFLGENETAYHVIPSKKDYVNLHENCFHIWAPVGEVKAVANLQDIQWEVAESQLEEFLRKNQMAPHEKNAKQNAKGQGVLVSP